MPIRESYSDSFNGEEDMNIRNILGSSGESENSARRLKRTLIRVMDNELTSHQKEIMYLYYFKGYSISKISCHFGITDQAVSAVMARARKRIFRILQYYL